MTAHRFAARPELTTVTGELLIGQNHIALLHGLYDRPGRTAPSLAAWVRASMPYVARFREHPSTLGLSLATGTLHSRWVKRVRRGHRIQVSLTKRGRAIVEHRLPIRIRGWGTYEGMQAINWRDRSAAAAKVDGASISPEFIREAVAYSNAYGIPLLKRQVENEKDVTIYAVTTGLDRSFRLVSREEIDLRGPRRWHAIWTQVQVDRGYVPGEYQEHFADFDQEDVLCYLRELARADRDTEVYCHTYAGRQFLSEQKLQEWLSEEINFRKTDIDSGDVVTLIRGLSATHSKVATAVSNVEALSWTHPDTDQCVGRVFSGDIDRDGHHDLVATNCVSLSCFQLYCDLMGLGIRIETRYILPSGEKPAR